MSYQTQPSRLRVKIFSARTLKGLENGINRWLNNVTLNVDEVIDIIYERHYNHANQAAVSTAMVIVSLA